MKSIQAGFSSNNGLGKDYKAFLIELALSRLRIGCLFAIVLVPLSSVLDGLTHPEYLFSFLKIRLICSFTSFLILFTSYFPRMKIRGLLLGIILTWCVAGTIAVMISRLGYDTPYYAGLNLIILTIGLLFPWGVKETFVSTLGIYAFYLVPSLFQSSKIASFPVYLNNNIFIVETIAIAVVSNYFSSKLRYQEFKSRSDLNTAYRKLQELDQAKTKFFSNISHEFRTPLTLILAPAEAMGKKDFAGVSEHDIKSSFAVIRDNALRLLRLINHLLDLMKIDAGKIELSIRSVDVKSFLKEVLETMMPLASQKGLDLQLDVSFAYEPDEPVTACFDRDQIEKVLMNLVYNAVKFTPRGGRILILGGVEDGDLKIAVQDTGIGIAPGMHEKIFDRFSQGASGSARNFEGTGIGLALCRELVKLHGGKIAVESELGRGAVFIVKLPFKKALASSKGTLTRPDQKDEWLIQIHRQAMTVGADLMLEGKYFQGRDIHKRTDDSKETILLVEDNPDLLNFLASELKSGFRLMLCRNGKEAWDIFSRETPDLIIADIMMPEMDGYELCRKVRGDARTQDIPFIFLSAKADMDMRLEGYQKGADDYLVKPFNIEELKAKVKAVLGLTRMAKLLREKNLELEKALVELKETKDEKIAYLGRMAAILSHEIRNPLQPMRTCLEVLSERPNDPAFASRMVETLYPFMDRMEGLVNQLFHLGQIENPVFQPVDLRHSIEEVLGLFAPKFEGRIELVKKYEEKGATIKVDKNQLGQVFFNLVKNAIEAMPGGGTLTFKTAIENRVYRIIIQDTGEGMSEETLKNLFRPFYTTKKEKGTGLGLSVSKQLIEGHGGTLTCQSKLGYGTTFTIEIPIDGKLKG